MTINEAVWTAIQGGYNENKPPFQHSLVTANRYWIVFKDANGNDYTIALEVALLDPKFWQALGKTMGWKESVREHAGYTFSREPWKDNMHRMADALIEGKTIEQYFETL